jgi:hypothetical protein
VGFGETREGEWRSGEHAWTGEGHMGRRAGGPRRTDYGGLNGLFGPR